MTGSTSRLDANLEMALRAVLLERVPRDVPASLLQHATDVRAHRPSLSVLGWLKRVTVGAMSTAAVLIVVVIAWTAAFGTRAADPSMAGSRPATHAWANQMVDLQADALTIEVAGVAFAVPASAVTHSDAGTSVYRTLELSWHDHGVEMRLYLYFGADRANWWVTSMRTYDGTSPGDWIYYVTPQVRAPLGQTWAGDVDVLGLGLHGVGRVRIAGLRVTAFAAGTIPHLQDGCRLVGRGQAWSWDPEIDGAKLAAGMAAAEAEGRLKMADACYQFRLEYPASNLGQIWCSAPPGQIREWAFGSDGRVIVFVEAAPAKTLAPESPQVVGC